LLGADRIATNTYINAVCIRIAKLPEIWRTVFERVIFNFAAILDASVAEAGKAIHPREGDRCHSDGGSNPEDEAGILAGQWMDYLQLSFAEYKSGEREQPKKMKEKMDTLSADDEKALLHFYGSQQ